MRIVLSRIPARDNYWWFLCMLIPSKHEAYTHIFSIKSTYYTNFFHLAFLSISDHTILHEHTHTHTYVSKRYVICMSCPIQMLQYLLRVLGQIQKLAQSLTSGSAMAGTLYLYLHTAAEMCRFWEVSLLVAGTHCPGVDDSGNGLGGHTQLLSTPHGCFPQSLDKMVALKFWECCWSRRMPTLSRCYLFSFNAHVFYYG